MKLNLEQIKSVTTGAAKIDFYDGKYVFSRFNDIEAKIIDHPYVSSPAGIQMNFKTDGNILKLKVQAQKSIDIRSYFSFDVFVDNIPAGTIQNFIDSDCIGDYANVDYPLGTFQKDFDLKDGDKYVKIHLPHSVTAFIEEIEIVDATYISPVKNDKTILFYGDSITQGFDSLHPSKSYASQLAELLNADAINKAVGGTTFNPNLVDVSNKIKPDYIVVAYGTNDWNAVDLETLQKNVKGFLNGIEKNYSGIPIFVITPLWRPDWREVKKCGEFFNVENTIKEIFGNRENITVISGFDLIPHSESIFGDLILHPSEKGFEHYTNNLLKYFQK
ncbi:MAG: SGNH/GDSL hydrolase family protein [Oscillospiraceae bacterium]|nr:SGNH/GDSL hydrolase family protein [Oscillospiraceae bacterium]